MGQNFLDAFKKFVKKSLSLRSIKVTVLYRGVHLYGGFTVFTLCNLLFICNSVLAIIFKKNQGRITNAQILCQTLPHSCAPSCKRGSLL